MKETPGAGEHTGGKGEDRAGHQVIIGDSIAPDATGADQKDLLPDADAIREALRYLHPDGPWMVNAKVGRGMPGRIGADLDAAVQWALGENGRGNNTYMAPARLRPEYTEPKKARDVDVEGSRWLWADLDPDKGNKDKPFAERQAACLARLTTARPADVPAPSAVVFSGGGYWGLWRLDEEVEAARLKPMLEWLEKRLGGDSVSDPSRIMRLPGTVNWPDDGKRAAGQASALAKFVTRTGVAHPVSAFGTEGGEHVPAAPADVSWDNLPRFESPSAIPRLSDRIRAVVATGDDDDKPYKSRSEAVFAVMCEMVRAGFTDSEIAGVVTDPSFEVSAHFYDPKGRKLRPEDRRMTAKVMKAVQGQIGRARARVAADGDEEGSGKADTRPEVMVDNNRLHLMLDRAEDALLASGLPLYQSAGVVVTPVRRHGGALRLRCVTATAMREHMTRAANFYSPSRDKNGNEFKKPASPPDGFTGSYVARADVGTCRLPVCHGLVGHPTIRADGSLLWAEGFDADTGLILDHGGVEFPPVPDNPTQEEALAALAKLKQVIKDFPYTDEASRSVALSAMLTAVCRRSLDFAPVHAFNAPSPETGKSLLSDIPSMMTIGQPAAKHVQDRNPEEDKKTLLGVLLQGDPVLVVDNVDRPIEGAVWCAILTSPEWEARGLGANDQYRVLTNVLFIFNGNNIEFRGDMATRAIMATIDAGVEEPAARTFDVDLREDMPKRRGELVSAALTLLRAHAVAGFPGAKRDTRFPGWSRLVRGALIWLGEPDPWDTRHAVRGGDSARDETVRLVDALEANFGRETFSARDVCREGGVSWADNATEAQTALAAALAERLPSVMDARGAPSALKVGHTLKRMRGRIIGGRAIIHDGHDKLRGNLFKVEAAGDV